MATPKDPERDQTECRHHWVKYSEDWDVWGIRCDKCLEEHTDPLGGGAEAMNALDAAKAREEALRGGINTLSFCPLCGNDIDAGRLAHRGRCVAARAQPRGSVKDELR